MDSINAPYYMYEGVPVLTDFSDPQQFYYLPNAPHIALDEQGRPVIRLIIFKENLDEIAPGDEQAVGFLYFDTSLAWPQETLDKVMRKLQSDLQLDNPPRLSPIFYKSGTVRLVFLDRATQLPGTPGSPGSPGQPGGGTTGSGSDQKWVTYIDTSGVPSLYGEERAIFSVMLTKKAVEVVNAAFDGFIPAGVIYQLTFDGMQQAYHIRAHVDWKQAYQYLRDHYQLDIIFFSEDFDNITSKLEDQKIITLQADVEDPASEGQFNEVRKTIQDLILDKFFKPVPNPNKQPDTSTQDGVVDTLRRLRDLGAGFNVGYSRIDYQASEIRDLDVDYTVSKAVERTIAPQGHLSVFFSDYKLMKEQIITTVNGEDELWKTLNFEVVINADFVKDGIESVSLDVYYDTPVSDTSHLSPTWSHMFDRNNTSFNKSAWYRFEVGNRFLYRYTVIFSPSAVPGADLQLSSGWLNHEGNVLVITPWDNLYSLHTVEAECSKNFPFDRYPQIQVEIRYQDPARNWVYQHTDLLASDKLSTTFSFRASQGAPTSVDYRLSYSRPGQANYEAGWQTSATNLILVDDPIRTKLEVQPIIGGDRTRIATLVLSFKYDDDANNVHETKSIDITQDTVNNLPEKWVAPLVDPTKRRYRYSMTLVDTDGNAIDTGWIQSDKTTLLVGADVVKHWEIQPELVGPPLSDNNLTAITVTLHYEDDANTYISDKTVAFIQPGAGESWFLTLKDASARQYTYTITYNKNTGFDQKVGPLASSNTFLTISSIPPAQ